MIRFRYIKGFPAETVPPVTKSPAISKARCGLAIPTPTFASFVIHRDSSVPLRVHEVTLVAELDPAYEMTFTTSL
jgi:hypothetical protein